ncbi:hypothetical protein I6F35_06245 [Bradyrhizobium sp. BRP22]|uniref:hypothetical protein n=1 Tax=Bradyrhizobium sp. BRP22 TaxID=2793821 RepID=UPI001CD6C0EB|nr:hypothetical protein [Bradyrhizobium sp. BRP22]MCA1452820.1 hypothetical protein [Bradyrhizobium sp. BRP22]
MGPPLIAVVLIVLHVPDGREVAVNPAEVTTLHQATGEGKVVTEGVHCVVNMTSGKFVSVIEDCGMVRKLIEARQ